MKRLLPLATLVALLVPAGSALAQGSGLNIHAIFEGARTSGFHVGEPLDVSYRRGPVRATRVCWTPAPIDRPACSRMFGAPARAGIQRFVITLSNGRKVRTTRRIRPAATRLPSPAPTASDHPVPFTVTCSATVFGTLKQGDPIATLSRGDRVAAYYRQGSIVQVYVYKTAQSGFMKQACLQRGLS
jgi:hypothetical protein